jgi:hypothetical protein
VKREEEENLQKRKIFLADDERLINKTTESLLGTRWYTSVFKKAVDRTDRWLCRAVRRRPWA